MTLNPADDKLMEKIQALSPQLVLALETLLRPGCPDNPELVRLYDDWLERQTSIEASPTEIDAALDTTVDEMKRVVEAALAEPVFSAGNVWRKVAMTLDVLPGEDSPEARLYREAVETLSNGLFLRPSGFPAEKECSLK